MTPTVPESLAAELGRVLAAELPITQSLGIAVVEAGTHGVTLALPLAANRNHKGTVFAGSLNAVATLAAWSTLWVVLRQAGVAAHVVIQDASVRYLAPAGSDVLATSACPDDAELRHALAVLARRGRARVAMRAEVRDGGGELVTTLQGRYVIHLRAG